ncbi:Uncharacterised protein [Mycobacteroides abscessus subsp. abscessus]|nr:Uncharacterised protein [Mycobacteroides abscessus subsp. abscessus]
MKERILFTIADQHPFIKFSLTLLDFLLQIQSVLILYQILKVDMIMDSAEFICILSCFFNNLP